MAQKQTISKGTLWMLLPVALLVTSVSGWLWMVSIAVDDPGFALEPDYYKKSSSYDDVMSQQARNSQLGHQVQVVSFSVLDTETAELIVQVKDREGRGIDGAEVTAEGLFVGRAFRIQESAFVGRGDGVYVATFNEPRPGLWEVRLRVTTEPGVLFTETLRPELYLNSGGTPKEEGQVPS